MRILFDHGAPSGIIRSLAGHEVTEAIERGWDKISNAREFKRELPQAKQFFFLVSNHRFLSLRVEHETHQFTTVKLQATVCRVKYGTCRLTFRFDAAQREVWDVNLEDYH